jgi:hypothetical protein
MQELASPSKQAKEDARLLKVLELWCCKRVALANTTCLGITRMCVSVVYIIQTTFMILTMSFLYKINNVSSQPQYVTAQDKEKA